MKKTSSFILLFGLIASLSIIGCGSTSNDPLPDPIGSDIIQQYDFHVEGEPTTTSLTLPQAFDDANWGLKEITCKEAGYSLIPYAGESVTAVKYNITEKYASEPLYLWVLAKDQTSVCGYLSVREGSTLTPGVFAVNDPSIK